MALKLGSLREFTDSLSKGLLVAGLFFLIPSTSVAQSDPIGSLSCLPMARVFSTAPSASSAGSFADSVLDEWKKMSRQEFGMSAIGPVGVAKLPRGTELNVVVDIQCLLDQQRGPIALPWLIRLKESVSPQIHGSSLRSFHWRIEDDWSFEVLQQAFQDEPCVHLVSPEGKFYIQSFLNDPFIRQQSHLLTMKYQRSLADFLMPIMVRNPVTIAVVDTGVDFAHKDLFLNRWTNQAEIPGNGIDDDGNGLIDDIHGYNFSSLSGEAGPQGTWPENKHGTHVAGLAAGRVGNRQGGTGIHGVAKIMSMNVFGANGYTRSSVLENAVRYAADHKADVINLSLGGREYSRSMRTALEYAVNKGSFIVAAAGNDGIELCDNPGSFDFISPAVYGSSIEGMLVTASTDISNGRLSRFSNFSQRLVEIAAPGAYSSQGQLIGLLSSVPTNQYAFMAGTSMAAPLLSGASALVVTWMKAYKYQYTPMTIERILRLSAAKDSNLEMQIQEGRSLDLALLRDHLKTNYPPRRFGPSGEPIVEVMD